MLTDSSSSCTVSKVSFGGHQSFTVRILGDFPRFLSALASNNAFIIKLGCGLAEPSCGGRNFEDKT